MLPGFQAGRIPTVHYFKMYEHWHAMNRRPIILTLLAAAGLLIFPISSAFSPQGVSFAPPDVPMAIVNPAFARQWRFLNQAKQVLPERVSYTVRSADPDSEMSLFMFSLGVLLDQQPLPTSYFGGAQAGGAQAEYILALEPFVPDETGVRVIARFNEGTVYRRAFPPR